MKNHFSCESSDTTRNSSTANWLLSVRECKMQGGSFSRKLYIITISSITEL